MSIRFAPTASHIRMPSPVTPGMLEVIRLLPRSGHFSPWQYCTRISTLPAKPPVATTTPLLARSVTALPSLPTALTPTTRPSSTIRLSAVVSIMMVQRSSRVIRVSTNALM